MRSIKDEVIGSSRGTARQTYTLTGINVSSLEIWVNELATLSEEEAKNIIKKGKLEVKKVQDESRNTVEFWIKWQAVKNLLAATKDDRHYEVITDESGRTEIIFGDGIYGAIPPAGEGNIRARYREGAGRAGNIPDEIAKELCHQIRLHNRCRWYSFYGIWCWGCFKFSKGNPAKMCYSNRPGNRGCCQVNKRYDRAKP
jgi:hypothetical protein